MYRGKSNEKLLEELLERGYGAEERKKWRDKWLRNQKAQRDLAKRRAGKFPPSYPQGSPESPAGDAASGPEDEGIFQRRAQDSVKAISPRLRRRIDAYAYRNGYLVVGIRERLRSMFSLFFPRIKDYVSNKAVRRLVVGKGFRWENPFNYCLADNLDALQFASRFLLGNYKTPKFSDPIISDESISGYIRREIASRNPAAVEFLSRFCERDEMLMRSLEFVKLRFARGARIESADLVRVVRSVYRLLFSTGNVDPDNLTGVYSTVVAVHRAYEPRPRQLNQIEENMGLFQMAYANLFEFKHQLFPVLLKLMGTFFRDKESMS